MSMVKRSHSLYAPRIGRGRLFKEAVQSPQKRPTSIIKTSAHNTATNELDNAMDEKQAIVAAIKHLSPEKAKGWPALQSSFDSVKFVAFDPVVTSIGVTPAGRFTSIANVLVSVNSIGFGGKKIRSSVTVPAIVDGFVSGKKANIENVQIRLESQGGSLPSRAVYAGAAE